MHIHHSMVELGTLNIIIMFLNIDYRSKLIEV